MTAFLGAVVATVAVRHTLYLTGGAARRRGAGKAHQFLYVPLALIDLGIGLWALTLLLSR